MVKKVNKKKIKKVVKKPPKKSTENWGFFLFFGVLFIGLPFVYYRHGLDPAIHPRLLFVNIMLILSLFAFLFIRSKQQIDYSVLRNPLLYFLGAYFLLTALSVLFAINPREGNYDANKTFSVFMLVVVMSLLLTHTPDWQKKLPLFILIPALFIIGVGVGEYYDYVLFATTERDPANLPWIYQVRGNMAHKNQFSIALMITLPFLGYGAYRYKNLIRVGFIVLILLILLAIFLLQTRSVWVALFMVLVIASVYVLIKGEKFNIPTRPRQIAGIGMLVFIIGFGSFVYMSKPANKDSVIYKIKNITNVNEGNNIHRYKTWNLSIDLMKDHLLTGVGAGNWKINSRYYFEQSGFNKGELNWLRPHNDYLWVVSEKGIFGFLAFLGIFVWTIIMGIKILFRSNSRDEIIFTLLMLMGLIAYMIASLFTFPLERINHQVYLALVLASVNAVYYQNFKTKHLNIKPIIPALFAIIILSYGAVYAISVLQMETKVKEARYYHRSNQWEKLLDISKTIPSTFKTLDAEAMPVAWYSGLSNSKLGNIKEANEAYYNAYKAHPTHIQVINNLGRTYFQLKEYEKARDAFLITLKILPDYYEALVNITSTYVQLGDYETAFEYYKQIKGGQKDENLLRMGKNIRRELRKQGKLPANAPGS